MCYWLGYIPGRGPVIAVRRSKNVMTQSSWLAHKREMKLLFSGLKRASCCHSNLVANWSRHGRIHSEVIVILCSFAYTEATVLPSELPDDRTIVFVNQEELMKVPVLVFSLTLFTSERHVGDRELTEQKSSSYLPQTCRLSSYGMHPRLFR